MKYNIHSITHEDLDKDHYHGIVKQYYVGLHVHVKDTQTLYDSERSCTIWREKYFVLEIEEYHE